VSVFEVPVEFLNLGLTTVGLFKTLLLTYIPNSGYFKQKSEVKSKDFPRFSKVLGLWVFRVARWSPSPPLSSDVEVKKNYGGGLQYPLKKLRHM
jgi:hypothetical protein